jgi:O-antigen ligase
VALFYAFQNAAPLGRKRVWLLSIFGAAVAVYFLATHDWMTSPSKIPALTRLGQVLQSPVPSLAVHRLHPNVAGGILAMMAPFAGLVTLWSSRNLGHRSLPVAGATVRAMDWLAIGVALACLLLILFGLVMSTSRGAWIALGCSLLLAAMWALCCRATRSAPTLGSWLFPVLVVVLLLAVLAVAAAWPGGIVAALRALPGPETGVSRVELLRNSLSLVRDYPLIGAGLGSFQMLYSTYVLFLHVGYIVHSHNLLVNVAVEQGLWGVLALLWMWGVLGAMLRARLKARKAGRPASDASGDDRTAALAAAVLCLVVVLVHGMVDDVLYGSRAVLLLFLPLGFGFRSTETRAAARGSRAWLSRWQLHVPASLTMILILALLWRKPLLSLFYGNLGAVHQSQAELSVYSWPDWPLQDEVRRSIDLSRPISEFERALALDPRNATAHRRLGMIDLSMGRYEQALPHLEAAYVAEPSSDVTRSLLGEAYVANGRLAEGLILLSSVGDSGGRLAARVFWYGYIGDEERQEWMRQAMPVP